MKRLHTWLMVCLWGMGVVLVPGGVQAQFGRPAPGEHEEKGEKKQFEKLPDPKGAKRLSPDYSIWIDPEKKQVIIDGHICVRNAWLEMFACPDNTAKDHESIVSLDTKAYLVHAALLSVGAEHGTPMAYEPKYRPATGTEIEIDVQWMGKDGKLKTAKAQEWVIDAHTKKPLDTNWVFAGSRFRKDPSGKEYYMAEQGHLICVSNFPTAALDIPIESPEANADLNYKTNTEKIPELGTPVRVILKPKMENPQKPEAKKEAESKAKE